MSVLSPLFFSGRRYLTLSSSLSMGSSRPPFGFHRSPLGFRSKPLGFAEAV